jgi:hypothetical protein
MGLSTNKKVFNSLWLCLHVMLANDHIKQAGTFKSLRMSFSNWLVSWLGGQSFWLLTMRYRVRFPVLPWKFSLAGEHPHSDHGLGSLQNLGFRPLLILQTHIYYPHSHYRDNVTVPYGHPKLRSRLHFGYNQEGGPWSLYGHVVAFGELKNFQQLKILTKLILGCNTKLNKN